MFAEPMHAARLALLEGALRSILANAQEGEGPDAPDEVVARLNVEGVFIEYHRAGIPVGGEGL